MNNIISSDQWAEWRLSPVTQAFLRYIKMKRQDIDRQKMELISGPAEQINPYELSFLNGIASTCNGILTLELKTMVDETHGFEDVEKAYKKMIKETFGADL